MRERRGPTRSGLRPTGIRHARGRSAGVVTHGELAHGIARDRGRSALHDVVAVSAIALIGLGGLIWLLSGTGSASGTRSPAPVAEATGAASSVEATAEIPGETPGATLGATSDGSTEAPGTANAASPIATGAVSETVAPPPSADSTPESTLIAPAEPTPVEALPSPIPATHGLQITEPRHGAVVEEEAVIVRGIAPPGATITRDIPFWFDEHTTADAVGSWVMPVRLTPGPNDLKFRIGDDMATVQTLRVTYTPAE